MFPELWGMEFDVDVHFWTELDSHLFTALSIYEIWH